MTRIYTQLLREVVEKFPDHIEALKRRRQDLIVEIDRIDNEVVVLNEVHEAAQKLVRPIGALAQVNELEIPPTVPVGGSDAT